MLSKIVNKTEFASRYFDKLRKPYKNRLEASSRFDRLTRVNITVFKEVLDEFDKEQQEILEKLENEGKLKFYKA